MLPKHNFDIVFAFFGKKRDKFWQVEQIRVTFKMDNQFLMANLAGVFLGKNVKVDLGQKTKISSPELECDKY